MEVSRSTSSPVQSTQKPTQIQKNQQENPPPRNASETSQTPSAPPRPVVNTQGQTTGRLLNVTA